MIYFQMTENQNYKGNEIFLLKKNVEKSTFFLRTFK